MSGPASKASLADLFAPNDPAAWAETRRAARHSGHLVLAEPAVHLPAAVWLWPTRRSYTGEPLLEIHTVASPPLLESILDALFARGVRPARAGEFTLRAFLAGRLDLTQAEAVLGVIDADDQRQLDQALRQLAGGVSQLLAPVRSDLLDLLADLEAGLDFVEEDIEFVTQDDLLRRLMAARTAIVQLLQQAGERMQSTARRRVVLAGLPNAGKSTLFNAVVGQAAALVSPAPGTTRDWLLAPVEWDGVRIDLVDTAGWEESELEIGRLAQDLRSEQWARADLIVWCTAADIEPDVRDLDERLQTELDSMGRTVLTARTKSDQLEHAGKVSEERVATKSEFAPIPVSAVAQRGLDDLKRAVADRLVSPVDRTGELLGSTAARCRESLAAAADSLARAEAAVPLGLGDELVAIELRETLDHLGRILGAVYTDDILDRLFGRFCIGK